MAKTKKTGTKKDTEVVVTLTIGSDSYTGSANSFEEAFRKITPSKFSGAVKMIVNSGGSLSGVPIRLTPIRLQRIFALDWEMDLFIKRLKILL